MLSIILSYVHKIILTNDFSQPAENLPGSGDYEIIIENLDSIPFTPNFNPLPEGEG